LIYVDQLKCTLVKKRLKFEVCILPCPKSTNFTYLLNMDIDIDIAMFCKYRTDIVSKLKSDIDTALIYTLFRRVLIFSYFSSCDTK